MSDNIDKIAVRSDEGQIVELEVTDMTDDGKDWAGCLAYFCGGRRSR